MESKTISLLMQKVRSLQEECDAWRLASGLAGVDSHGGETDPATIKPADLLEWDWPMRLDAKESRILTLESLLTENGIPIPEEPLQEVARCESCEAATLRFNNGSGAITCRNLGGRVVVEGNGARWPSKTPTDCPLTQ